MRKYFIFILLAAILIPTKAAAWGLLDAYVDNQKGSVFLTEKLMNEEEITYCLDGDLHAVSVKDAQGYVETAFEDWTLATANYIESNKRGKEFEAILPMLKNAKLSLTGCSGEKYFANEKDIYKNGSLSKDYYGKKYTKKADFTVVFREICSTGKHREAAGFAHHYKNKGGPTICMNTSYGVFTYSVIAHEMGHLFGLADQYKDEFTNASINYLAFLADWNDFKIKPVMGSSDKPSCDDMDGMIAAINVKRNRIGFPSWTKWTSLCNDRQYELKRDHIAVNAIKTYYLEGPHKGKVKVEPGKEEGSVISFQYDYLYYSDGKAYYGTEIKKTSLFNKDREDFVYNTHGDLIIYLLFSMSDSLSFQGNFDISGGKLKSFYFTNKKDPVYYSSDGKTIDSIYSNYKLHYKKDSLFDELLAKPLPVKKVFYSRHWEGMRILQGYINTKSLLEIIRPYFTLNSFIRSAAAQDVNSTEQNTNRLKGIEKRAKKILVN